MIAKDGRCYSPVKLAWDRRQPCSFGHLHPDGAHPGGESHHYPAKAMGGARLRDDKTCPVCRACHMRCEGQTVAHNGKQLGPISFDEQERAVHVARSRFIEEASLLERRQFFRDVETWAEAREASLPVPY